MSHGGLQIDRMIIALVRDLLTREPHARPKHHQPAARAAALPGVCGLQPLEQRSVDIAGWTRKIKESLVALQIEKRYTKHEILTMYCNKVAWGNRAFGVEAASQLYFGKSAKELTLDEAATLAGMLPAPQRLNPYANMDAAKRRRNYTLDRMVADRIHLERGRRGGQGASDRHARRAEPAAVDRAVLPRGPADRARGALRTPRRVYEGGLVIKTGLDGGLQRAANRALDSGLRRLDKLRGYRTPARNLVAEKRAIDTYRHPRWARDPIQGDIMPAVVTEVADNTIKVRVGRFTGDDRGRRVSVDAPGGQGCRSRAGDLVEVRVGVVNTDAPRFRRRSTATAPRGRGRRHRQPHRTGSCNDRRLQLRAEPVQPRHAGDAPGRLAVQAVRLHGGDRQGLHGAVAARRLPCIVRRRPGPAAVRAAELRPRIPWQGHAAHGARAVAQRADGQAHGRARTTSVSSSTPATSASPRRCRSSCRSRSAPPKRTLLEMTSAYSAFPNQGVRADAPLHPRCHRPRRQCPRAAPTAAARGHSRRHGLHRHEPSPGRRPARHGARPRARSTGRSAARPGTTDDYIDAWFIGFDPEITIGVWVGFDQKRPIGANQTGHGRRAAHLAGDHEIVGRPTAARTAEPPTFERPGNSSSSQPSRPRGLHRGHGTELRLGLDGLRGGAAEVQASQSSSTVVSSLPSAVFIR